jgi:GNAT superfamily N-acetyltransferase
MSIEIRPAVRAELRETAVIYIECIREDYCFKPQSHLDALDVDKELAECEDWMAASGRPNQVFAALDGERMAGYIAVGPNTGEPREYDGEVCGFFLRKAYRRQGTGLRLLKAGLEYLRDRGFRRVAIYNYHVSAANQYYRGLGGKLVWQEIQHPGGMELETDVFGWEIAEFLEIIEQKLRAKS